MTKTASTPILSAIAVSAADAAAICGMSRSKWYSLHAAGLCPRPIRVGGKTLWLVDDLKAWMAVGAPTRAKWEKQQQSQKGQ